MEYVGRAGDHLGNSCENTEIRPDSEIAWPQKIVTTAKQRQERRFPLERPAPTAAPGFRDLPASRPSIVPPPLLVRNNFKPQLRLNLPRQQQGCEHEHQFPDGRRLPDDLGLVVHHLLLPFFNTGPTNTILANATHPSICAAGFALNILVILAFGDVVSPVVIGIISDCNNMIMEGQFDGILSWAGSFGYFPETENARLVAA